nr:hypothetical protein [Arenimonas sp.]
MKPAIVLASIALVFSTAVSAQAVTGMRPAKMMPSPDVMAAAVQQPAAEVQSIQSELASKLQALADQVSALQAENAQLKASLEKLNAQVDANQSNQTAAVSALKQTYEGHTHSYNLTSIGYKTVKIDGESASYIFSERADPHA